MNCEFVIGLERGPERGELLAADMWAIVKSGTHMSGLLPPAELHAVLARRAKNFAPPAPQLSSPAAAAAAQLAGERRERPISQANMYDDGPRKGKPGGLSMDAATAAGLAAVWPEYFPEESEFAADGRSARLAADLVDLFSSPDASDLLSRVSGGSPPPFHSSAALPFELSSRRTGGAHARVPRLWYGPIVEIGSCVIGVTT